MNFHSHYQNLDNRRQTSRLGHWWLYGQNGRALVEAGAQFVHPHKPRREFSARLHFGTKGSETPIDAHLTIAGTGAYVNLGADALRRACHFLTRGEGRDLSLAMRGGQLWWSLWVGEGHCNGTKHSHRRGGRYQPWRCRSGNIPVNPLDVAYGSPKYSYEDLSAVTRTLVMPEDEYEVKLTLRRQRHGRKGGKQRDDGLVVDWKAEKGIPFHFDHSGGWKGSRYYASAVRMPDGVEEKDWPAIALARLAAKATHERVSTGWTVEHEAEQS